ncbi:hypothetical protein CVD28_03890 [Bacillus sp. M6-12]|uniref:hypothetical protein n=1 Tax=Bacillus sp. M6-12 TaxID=2054166 RepID=UPI000C7946C7|nr:hypothetical protein [Bacillus sp. M6-12]PLS19569.1 hypothetical protein CVD28_03890 [Bacillus sp. M6-12]
MNIQISSTLLNKETRNDFFLPRSFYQANNRLFFVGNFVNQNYFNVVTTDFSFYSAIELTGNEEHYSVSDEVMVLKVNNETEELLEILSITSIPEEEAQDEVWIETFEWLFLVLRNERGEINATYSSDIVSILYRTLKQYAFKTSAFHSGKQVEVNLLDTFQVTGEASTGYYEGNILIKDWKVIEIYSGNVVAELGDIQLPQQLFIEEDDSEDDVLEAFVDSMSRTDIISLALKALQQGIKQEVFQYEKDEKMVQSD